MKGRAVETVNQLRVAHESAKETRRLLEAEKLGIPGRIKYARSSGADLAEVESLGKRGRELSDLCKAAGEREREAYGAYVRAKYPDPDKAEMIIRLGGG